MAIGGVIALILDNIIPGTDEERGILKWRSMVTSNDNAGNMASVHVYDLPFGFTKNWKFAKYLPFLPNYDTDDTITRTSPTYHHEEVPMNTPSNSHHQTYAHQTYI